MFCNTECILCNRIRKDKRIFKKRIKETRWKKWTKKNEDGKKIKHSAQAYNQMLFGYFPTSIFQDALTSALCKCVYFCLRFFFHSFVLICVLGNDWVYRLCAAIKSPSHHYLCNSNDRLNCSISFVCVCMFPFLRCIYIHTDAFVCANSVDFDPLVFFDSKNGRVFLSISCILLLLIFWNTAGCFVHNLFIFIILLWTPMRWITNAILCIVFCTVEH